MNRIKSFSVMFLLALLAIFFAGPAHADNVINDDLIVTWSTCIGFDCATDNSESFGFDTLRLKENNLRIKFEDTSIGAFPSTDWQIIVNDSSSGGRNYFGIDNVTDNQSVLRIYDGDGNDSSVALGQNATSTGTNSVVLGSGSTDGGENNVVSVGATGNERRIINVAAGVNNTDAVNVSQLNTTADSTLASANAYTDSSIAGSLASAKDYTDRRIDDLSDEAHRGIAGAIAMSRAYIPLNPGESGIAAGFGASGGEGAIALSIQHYTKDNVYFNMAASFDTENVHVGGGFGFKF